MQIAQLTTSTAETLMITYGLVIFNTNASVFSFEISFINSFILPNKDRKTMLPMREQANNVVNTMFHSLMLLFTRKFVCGILFTGI